MKPTRELPTSRDFGSVKQSMPSVSSMGIHTRGSILSQQSLVASTLPEVDVESDEAVER